MTPSHAVLGLMLAACVASCAGAPALSVSGLGLRIGSEPGAECVPRSAAQNMVEGVRCVQPAADAGAACNADSQCEGVCEMDADTAPGMPASGHCSATAQAKPGSR